MSKAIGNRVALSLAAAFAWSQGALACEACNDRDVLMQQTSNAVQSFPASEGAGAGMVPEIPPQAEAPKPRPRSETDSPMYQPEMGPNRAGAGLGGISSSSSPKSFLRSFRDY